MTVEREYVPDRKADKPRQTPPTFEELRFEIECLDAKIEDLKDQAVDLRDEIASLKTQREELQDKLDDCED